MTAVDVLFVCVHGSAKSVVAAELFRRQAAARRLAMTAASAGIEADETFPAGVVAGLAEDGIDVGAVRPTQLTGAIIACARLIVLLGCRLLHDPPPTSELRQWDDIPAVSDGYRAAHDAILERVVALVDELA